MTGPTNGLGKTEEELATEERLLRERDEQIADTIDPTKETVAAGLTTDQIGLNAISQTDLTDPTRPDNNTSGMNSQTLTDVVEGTTSGYGSGQGHGAMDSQKEQYDTATSGAAKGRHAGTIFDQICEAKRLMQEEEEKNFRSRVAMYATIANLTEFDQAYEELTQEIREIEAEGSEVMAEAEVALTEIDKRIQQYENDLLRQEIVIARQEEELAELRESFGDNPTAEQLATLQERSDHLDMLREQHRCDINKIEVFKTARGELEQGMQDYQQSMARLQAEQRSVELARGNLAAGDKDGLAAATDRLQEIARLKGEVEEQIQHVTGATNFVQGLPSFMAKAEAAGVEVDTAAMAAAMHMARDGVLETSELAQLQQMTDGQSIPPEIKKEFMNLIENSGIGVKHDGEIVRGADAIDLLKGLRDEKAGIQQELNSLKEQQATLAAQGTQLSAQLEAAHAAVEKEQAETVEVTADAADAEAAMMQYDSISSYMIANYNYMGAGNTETGMNITEVAKNPDLILKDDSGNLVFVDPETQRLYIHEKDPATGEVARDADGNQIRQELGLEQQADLYRQMFEEKLVPRNFVPDGDGFNVLGMTVGDTEGSIAEFSEEHGFLTTMTASVGGMGKDQFSALMDEFVAEQQAQEQQAVAAEQVATAGQSEAQLELLRLQQEQTAANLALKDVEQRIAAIEQQTQGVGNLNTGTAAAGSSVGDFDSNLSNLNALRDAPALQTSNELQFALQDVFPLVESGTITRDQLEETLKGASPELTAQIEQALENDGVQIQEPEDVNNDINIGFTPVNYDFNFDDFNFDDFSFDLGTNSDLLADAQITPFSNIGPLNYTPIPSFSPTFDPNGVQAASSVQSSFADSDLFASYNVDGLDASYNSSPINNGASAAPSAFDNFALAYSGQTSSSSGNSDSDKAAIDRERELQIAGLTSSGGGLI